MNLSKVIEKIKNDEVIGQIRAFVQNYHTEIEIYLVGGVVRDFYLGKNNYDKDLVVSCNCAQSFAKELSQHLDATFVLLDDKNKIYRLVLKDKVNFVDVAEMVGCSIEEDLKRRDLTINAIAVNMKTFETVDATGGIADLASKKIRQISEQNFVDDPLRLLRVFRFQSILGFDLDPELLNIVSRHVGEIQKPAVERINYELLKTFSGKYCDEVLVGADKIGLLDILLPKMNDVKKIPPNSHHHLNLFMHSVEVVKQIQSLYEKASEDVKLHMNESDFGGFDRLTYLKFAGFLHDIGKPDTWTIEEDTGRHRFIKHDDVGSKLTEAMLKKNKFSKKQIEYICKMVKFHIYPSHVVSSPEISDKIYMRFVRKMDKDVIDIIFLAMADRLSARGVEITDEIVNNNLNNLNALLNFYLNIKDALKPLPKLLSGEDIMEYFSLKPSKELGVLVKALNEAQLAGEVNTKDEAVTFLESVVNGRK